MAVIPGATNLLGNAERVLSFRIGVAAPVAVLQEDAYVDVAEGNMEA